MTELPFDLALYQLNIQTERGYLKLRYLILSWIVFPVGFSSHNECSHEHLLLFYEIEITLTVVYLFVINLFLVEILHAQPHAQ
jgi:hypothetical protein